MSTIVLRRLLSSVENGAWGTDPGEAEVDAQCVRAADFDFDRLRVDLAKAPTRGLDTRTWERLRLNSGDIVLEKSGGGEAAPVGRAVLFDDDKPAVTSNFAARVRPTTGVDSRFLVYVLRSLYDSGVTLKCIKQTTGIQNLDTEHWLQSEVPSPPLDEQRRIASFLDDRVARIDLIITARRQQLGLVGSFGDSEASGLLSGLGLAGPPLSAVADIIDTEHKTAPTVPGGGRWIAGTSAIRNGVLVAQQLRETDAESFQEWTSRGVPRPGDVLLTREAPVGEVALLTNEDRRVAIGQRVVLLKPHRQSLHPAFLRLALMAGGLRQVIDQASAGSLHPHLNMADISRMRIPGLSIDEQAQLGSEHQDLLEDVRRRSSQVDRSIALLQEYKQSLITAAVTGQIDLTTAGSRIPG